jgi:hypothetical protein
MSVERKLAEIGLNAGCRSLSNTTRFITEVPSKSPSSYRLFWYFSVPCVEARYSLYVLLWLQAPARNGAQAERVIEFLWPESRSYAKT